MASLNEYNANLSRKEAAHLLRRCTFGPTIDEINQYEGMNVSVAVDSLFPAGETLPSPPIDPQTGASWVNPPTQYAAGGSNSQQDTLHGYFKAWHTDVMRKSGLSLTERITWFYHTHLPARWTKILSSEAIYYQNGLYRHYASGSFKELFKKICVDNAMLVYLDGATNHKNNPNENFAREMLELYSIGKGPQIEEGNYTNYTEDDVRAATKVLTGWALDDTFTNIDPDTGLPTGNIRMVTQGDPPQDLATGHDATTKTFSTVFNSQQISPAEIIDNLPTVAASYQELDDMIEMIFGKIETARFITRKLYRFFVYHFITDEVENDIIIPLAQVFYDADYDMVTLLKTILKSQHFYDADNAVTTDNNIGALIKSPVDLNLGLLRFFGVDLPDRETQTTQFYTDMENLVQMFMDQGLSFYEPFEVAGYPAYHQIPGYNRNWITTYDLANRYQAGNILMKIGGFGENLSFMIDILDWIENSGYISDPGDANEVVSVLTQDLIAVDLNTDRFDYFLNTVFLDTFNPATWAYEWQKYLDSGDDLVVRERFEMLLNALIQTPEFQLI